MQSRGRRIAHTAWKTRLWWWLGGVAAVVVATTLIALGTTGGLSASSAPAVTDQATPTVSATEQSPTVSATPTATESATPTPTATTTRAVDKAPYCAAFAKIKTGSVSTSSEDGSVDLNALAKRFSTLIKSYSTAAKSAPSSLDKEYATVLGFLREMRATVLSKDVDDIKLMISNLDLLNDAMTSISTQSHKICN